MTVSFIIPFHNEEKNCRSMVTRVDKFAHTNKLNYEIIPVDDRSTDRTAEILAEISQKNGKIKPVYRIKDSRKLGNTMGKALIAGTNKAIGEFVIWTMGDLADSTVTYKEIINKLYNNYDLVFGSRYMPGGSWGNLDPLKAFLSSSGTRLARILFGIKVHDITNAFRGFRRDIFNSLKLEETGFSISPEFAIKAYFKGLKLGEVPTTYTNRVEGVSSFKLYQMTHSYIFLYLKLFFKYKLKPHKLP